MVYRTISRDLKLAAVKLYDAGHMIVEDICDCVGFSTRTFSRIHRLWTETGDVVKHKHGIPGRRRELMLDDVMYLLRLVRQRPDWFLEELADLLRENRFLSVHFSTIHRELLRHGYTSKKLRRIAKERN
ncbi:Homeodomain-like protein, partial [Schizophyllum commune]|uniref:uncharacterized protein n=1 Tax=Schizophyllum commune (strain H4-8 / FGSC 9210) TaxID=578458 RepID=UPI00215EC9E5